jgi:hypothetical protein
MVKIAMVIGTRVNGRDDNVPVLHGDVLPSDGTSADFFPPWTGWV